MEEFLLPFGISLRKLSYDIVISQQQLEAIVEGRERITADIALRLSQYFGNSAKFWLGLQDDYDIEEGMEQNKVDILSILRFKQPVSTSVE